MFSGFFKHTTPVVTDEARVDEVLTRGVVEVIHHDSLRKKLLSGRRLRVKLGIDPTSPNLHLGRAVPLMKLRDFQQLGHDVVLIVGDGTGVVGDTSDKDSERPMLTQQAIHDNMRTYFTQAAMLLDISRVEKRYNSQWLHRLSYDAIGEHADQFSVADFIARDNIKRRLDDGKRVSLREVLYPLMQGYDSVAVHADVELGGTDQRFNLLAGRALQEHFGQESQDILMTPLIDGTDGRKMSSSWGNTIALTAAPDDMYAKVMSVDDAIIEVYFTVLTRVPMDDVARIVEEPPLDAKMRLAHEIVSLLHSSHEADAAHEAFVRTFQKGDTPENVPTAHAHEGELLVDVLIREKLVSSRTDFKRLVADGAVTHKTTDTVITDAHTQPETGVYKVGKHRFLEIV